MKQFSFLILFLILGFSSFGQSKKELEERKLSTLKELQIAKDLLDKTNAQKQNSLKRLGLLNKGIESRVTLIATISSEIDQLDRQIDALESETKKLELNITMGKKEYAEILYYIYKNHTEEEKLMYLLASENINQFYQRVKYLKYLKEYREAKVMELAALKKDLEERTAELLKVRNDKLTLLQEKESESRALQAERIERNGMVRRLSQDETRIRKQISEKERISKEIEEKIRKIIEEEARKSSSNTLYSSLTPEQKLVGNSFMQNKGRLPWPVDRGVITADFGLVSHPVLSGVKINNNGIDISSVPGTKARAIFDGEVSSVFAILGANYAVIVMHGEYLSVYQNLIDLKVKAGDKVVAKQELGTIHADDDISILTLQIWKSREILNPASWISK